MVEQRYQEQQLNFSEWYGIAARQRGEHQRPGLAYHAKRPPVHVIISAEEAPRNVQRWWCTFPLPPTRHLDFGAAVTIRETRFSSVLDSLPAPVVRRGSQSSGHDATGSKKPIPFNQLPFLFRQLLSADLNLFKEPRVTGHLSGLLTATSKWCHCETLGPSIVAFEFVGFDLCRGGKAPRPPR
jgi:hypothetical protein